MQMNGLLTFWSISLRGPMGAFREEIEMSQGSKKEDFYEERIVASGAGIFGREFCERCGGESEFHGMWGAMLSHKHSRRFTCQPCYEAMHGDLNKRNGFRESRLDKLVLKRGFRYCENCGVEVPLVDRSTEELHRRPWTCENCVVTHIGRAARRRYAAHLRKQGKSLDRLAGSVLTAEREISEITGGKMRVGPDDE